MDATASPVLTRSMKNSGALRADALGDVADSGEGPPARGALSGPAVACPLTYYRRDRQALRPLNTLTLRKLLVRAFDRLDELEGKR